METENRNELIELFGKLFGEAVANEIQKYDSRKVNEAEYSEDVKNIKRIIDISVENICSSIESAIESAKKEILERIDLDSKRLPDLPDTIRPLTDPNTSRPWITGPQILPNTPNTYPYTPNPLDPLGPVIIYGNNDDRVTMTTTAGDKRFPATHTYTSLTAEDIDDVLYSMFGQ